uniref:Uncharacterized protein n=1 Tax=Romanomermis culicivorax TaxID=13658 RepID=A0A915L1W2_ROMCU
MIQNLCAMELVKGLMDKQSGQNKLSLVFCLGVVIPAIKNIDVADVGVITALIVVIAPSLVKALAKTASKNLENWQKNREKMDKIW